MGLEADKGIPDVGSMKFRVVKRQYRKSKEIQIRPFGSKKGIKEDAEIILGQSSVSKNWKSRVTRQDDSVTLKCAIKISDLGKFHVHMNKSVIEFWGLVKISRQKSVTWKIHV